jgi:hypothetical protein
MCVKDGLRIEAVSAVTALRIGWGAVQSGYEGRRTGRVVEQWEGVRRASEL